MSMSIYLSLSLSLSLSLYIYIYIFLGRVRDARHDEPHPGGHRRQGRTQQHKHTTNMSPCRTEWVTGQTVQTLNF